MSLQGITQSSHQALMAWQMERSHSDTLSPQSRQAFDQMHSHIATAFKEVVNFGNQVGSRLAQVDSDTQARLSNLEMTLKIQAEETKVREEKLHTKLGIYHAQNEALMLYLTQLEEEVKKLKGEGVTK